MSIEQCANRTPEPEWDPQIGSGGTWFLSSCPQDVDGVFLSKMELEGKLASLREYICFLRQLYEEVRVCQVQGGLLRAGGSEGRGQGRQPPWLQWEWPGGNAWYPVIQSFDKQTLRMYCVDW